jgi:hypothetical protein
MSEASSRNSNADSRKFCYSALLVNPSGYNPGLWIFPFWDSLRWQRELGRRGHELEPITGEKCRREKWQNLAKKDVRNYQFPKIATLNSESGSSSKCKGFQPTGSKGFFDLKHGIYKSKVL